KIDQENKVIHSIFLLTIGLKLVYDLIVELGCLAKRLKLLVPGPAIGFWKKLTYELKLTEDALEVLKESELYIEDWCLDYV
ncbi:8490_t:CDS:2, partial [Gigaspora rosea]